MATLVRTTVPLDLAVHEAMSSDLKPVPVAAPGYSTQDAYGIDGTFVATEAWDTAGDHGAFFQAGQIGSERRRRRFPVMRRSLVAFFGMVLMFGLLSSAAGADPGGNSAAAQACQQDGYMSLVGTNGGFANAGECTSYAAQGGRFVTPAAGEFLLPAGQTATLSNTSFRGCNALTYGYQLSGGPFTPLGSKPAGCASTGPQPDATIGPFPTAVIFRIVLVDNTCIATYDSTGNHARVTGTNPAVVDIFDAGGLCEAATSPRTPADRPAGTGDFTTTVTIA